MDLDTIMDGADRFATYVEELTSVIGHADRAAPLRDYCAVSYTHLDVYKRQDSTRPFSLPRATLQASIAKPWWRAKSR